MGLQLRWLERTPDKREVGGSSPPRPTINLTAIIDCFVGHKNIENRITVYISGQETKGARRMPWHQEAKKDVTSNENLEQEQISSDSGESEWGNLLDTLQYPYVNTQRMEANVLN